MYVLPICQHIRILSKILSASPSKDIKTVFVEGLCCHYIIELVTTKNLVNSSTVDKTRHGSVFALFSVQLLQFFSCAGGAIVTNLFYCYSLYALAMQQTRRICGNLFYL